MLGKMKQLMEMKKQADVLKKQLDQTLVDVEEVSGISLSVTGSQDFRSIEIEERLLGVENKEALQRAILRSINAAVKKSQGVAAKQMASIMPGF